MVFTLHYLVLVKVTQQIKRLGLIAGSVILLAGMKAWAEPGTNDRHLVESALQEFRKDVSAFEKGIIDPDLQKNLSVPTLLLKRALLMLKGTKGEEREVKALKEFSDVEKAVRGLIDAEPSLKELSEKLKKGEPIRVKDLGAVEKAILTTKTGKALIENGTVAKLTEIVGLEVEKSLDGAKSSEDLLNLMARTKLTALPKEWELGEDSALLKKINGS